KYGFLGVGLLLVVAVVPAISVALKDSTERTIITIVTAYSGIGFLAAKFSLRPSVNMVQPEKKIYSDFRFGRSANNIKPMILNP
ncbi:MAG TPA: hypothetical protein VK976_03845, partial [Verrucomicrobiae bacterium]|nr:hypothetical protein [Verrucomicrobiae bacterium]